MCVVGVRISEPSHPLRPTVASMDLDGDDPPDCPRCLHSLRWTGTARYPFWECAHCGFFAATL